MKIKGRGLHVQEKIFPLGVQIRVNSGDKINKLIANLNMYSGWYNNT